MTAQALLSYVGGNATDETFAQECIDAATELVSAYLGEAVAPESIQDRAVLEVGSELFHRRQAPNGIAQFATPDGTPAVRVARDPMVAAYALLAPYVGLGIG